MYTQLQHAGCSCSQAIVLVVGNTFRKKIKNILINISGNNAHIDGLLPGLRNRRYL